MTAAEDKVTPLPTVLERLAKRAGQAMVDYHAGLADQSKGRHQCIQAVIVYGRALLEGREGRSNQDFKQWVSANKLDVGVPWDRRPERTAAMLIAGVVRGGSPSDVFYACHYTRPVDIMKWYRHATGKSKHNPSKRPSRRISKKSPEAAKSVMDGGKTQQEAAKEQQLGSVQGVKISVAHEQGYRQAYTELLDATAAKNFTEKGVLRIEDAIRVHTARLNKQFEQRVNEEVRRRIDAADNAAREQNKQLRRENMDFQRIIGQRGVFTKTQFRQMQLLCHPDSSASEKTKAELSQILVENEKKLVKI